MRSLSAAVALVALGMAAEPDVYEVRARPLPERRRRVAQVAAVPSPPRAANFIGDGCDDDRIQAAERKRARKAAKLRADQPKDNPQALGEVG